MQFFKNYSDERLLSEILECVREERRSTLAVLYHLREIERRRLYSELRYSSLFTYCVEELGYSESAAQRRIQSMRLLSELPEIAEKVESGELSLSNLAKAETFFRQERRLGKKYSAQEKEKVLSELEGSSSREAERVLLGKNPEHLKFWESARAVSPELTELKMLVGHEFLRDLEKLKGALAHRMPRATSQEALAFAMKLALEKLLPTPAAKPKKRMPTKAANEEKLLPASAVSEENLLPTSAVAAKPVKSENLATRENRGAAVAALERKAVASSISGVGSANVPLAKKAIPRPLRREVFQKAGHKCENCGSQYALESDHIHPRALGGTNAPQNLRLLCRSCNQRAAIRCFGPEKIEAFLAPD